MIVLAQKPHQENIINIEDFIWCICVSYCRINAVTKSFQFTIPGCGDAIITLGDGAGNIWIVSLDSRQGYYQISVRKVDREKLALFDPNDRKYTFNVISFGPTNAPAFYTAILKGLKDEWGNFLSYGLQLRKTTIMILSSLWMLILSLSSANLLFGVARQL